MEGSCYEKERKDVLIQLLTDLSVDLSYARLLEKIISHLKILFSTTHCQLFLFQKQHRRLQRIAPSTLAPISFPLGEGFAGETALTRETLNLGPEAILDARFRGDIDAEAGVPVQGILCMPILNHLSEIIGVAQITNKNWEVESRFTKEDEKLLGTYLGMCGSAIVNAQLLEESILEQQSTSVVLDLAKNIFEKIDNPIEVTKRIILHAAGLVDCDRCSLFKVDRETNELYAEVFDATTDARVSEGEGGGGKKRDLKNEIRFPMRLGIAGHVATTGETLNIPDAYTDERFNEEIDKKTGYKTKSILCMPIYNAAREIVGVAQLVNKRTGLFTEKDEKLFETFAIFCGLGLHSSYMYDQVQKSAMRSNVVLEVLSYHSRASVEATDKLVATHIPTADELGLNSCAFDDRTLDEHTTLAATVRMYIECGFVDTFRIPYRSLCQFVASVKKNYRDVTYHNWRHAFNVTQCTYYMINCTPLKDELSALEQIALLTASLCHDLDHRGTNNAFQNLTETSLSRLYSTSTMEHHHFDQCIMLINSEGNNFMINVDMNDYKRFVMYMEQAILATDLAIYMKIRKSYFDLVKENKYDWTNTDHRKLLRNMMMTAADISAITRPWSLQRCVAEIVYAEFYEQGDLEKNIGHNPAALNDREKVNELPKMQIGFIDFICAPIYEALALHFPALKPLHDAVMGNRQKWADLQGRYSPLLPKLSSTGVNGANSTINTLDGCNDSQAEKLESTKKKKKSGKLLQSAVCGVM